MRKINPDSFQIDSTAVTTEDTINRAELLDDVHRTVDEPAQRFYKLWLEIQGASDKTELAKLTVLMEEERRAWLKACDNYPIPKDPDRQAVIIPALRQRIELALEIGQDTELKNPFHTLREYKYSPTDPERKKLLLYLTDKLRPVAKNSGIPSAMLLLDVLINTLDKQLTEDEQVYLFSKLEQDLQ